MPSLYSLYCLLPYFASRVPTQKGLERRHTTSPHPSSLQSKALPSSHLKHYTAHHRDLYLYCTSFCFSFGSCFFSFESSSALDISHSLSLQLHTFSSFLLLLSFFLFTSPNLSYYLISCHTIQGPIVQLREPALFINPLT